MNGTRQNGQILRHAEFISASFQIAQSDEILKQVPRNRFCFRSNISRTKSDFPILSCKARSSLTSQAKDDVECAKKRKTFRSLFSHPCSLSRAFTLAEVLLTLGIIGIVAAFTIPTLMNNVQNEQFKVAAKKQYSILSQAYANILNDNGEALAGVCPGTDVQRKDCFVGLFANQLKYTKRCYAYSDIGKCFPDPFYNYNKTQNANSGGYDGGLLLSDGTGVWFVLWYTNCDHDYTFNSSTRHDYCGWIAFDVNGFNKPNTLGRDIFTISVFNKQLEPHSTVFGANYLYNVMNNISY